MKKIIFLLIPALTLLLTHCAQEKVDDGSKIEFPTLKDSYLGQTPPGKKAKIFAPGIFNNKKTAAFCTVFSKDRNEFYYTSYDKLPKVICNLFVTKKVGNSWTEPQPLPFNSSFNENDLCLSEDGSKMVFRSWRPLPDSITASKYSHLWISERVKNNWSEAKPLLMGGRPIQSGYPSMARNGNLYFSHQNNLQSGVFRSKIRDGKYSSPEYLFSVLDTHKTEGDLFISHDESYLIIACSNHPENMGQKNSDLYITFNLGNNKWSEAFNMGTTVNSKFAEHCPAVTLDGKYLFFNRYDPETDTGNMYWIDADIIEDLKPKNLSQLL